MKVCKICLKTKDLTKFEKFRHQCTTCRSNNRNKSGKRRGDGWRNERLSYLYGISLEDYNKMAEQQNHTCKICKKPNNNPRYNGRLVVDHCHTTGTVRGLLCDKCNRAIGQFNDNIEYLNNAIKYLTKA